MTIEVTKYDDLNKLMEETNSYITYIDNDKHFFYDLDKDEQSNLRYILKNSKIVDTINFITNEDKNPDIDYQELSEFEDRLKSFSNIITGMKEKIDLDKFVKSGQFCNFKKLKKIWNERKLKHRFPNFDFKAYEQWLTNPPLTMTNFSGEVIEYDSFMIVKLLNLLHQMVFDEDDILLVFCGKEGSAKSTLASQIMLYMYNFIKTVGLNSYEYKPELMFYVDIKKMLDFQEELEYNDYFRILHFDEGDQLARTNHHDKDAKEYKSDLRRGRKNQRIKSIASPQIGELSLEIVTTRTQFIFNTIMNTDNETKLLNKGTCNLYIIPKGDFVYSDFNKREIPRSEILTKFHEQLKSKDNYYKPLPLELCVRQFKFNRFFGFDKLAYDKHIKNENKLVRNDGRFELTYHQAFVLLKEMPDFSEWGFDTKEVVSKRNYTLMRQFKHKIKKFFLDNPKIYQEMKMKDDMTREFN